MKRCVHNYSPNALLKLKSAPKYFSRCQTALTHLAIKRVSLKQLNHLSKSLQNGRKFGKLCNARIVWGLKALFSRTARLACRLRRIQELLTCHWRWSPWWHNIGVAGSHQQRRCGAARSDGSWLEWHAPSPAVRGCGRSRCSPAWGLAVGSAGLMWCCLLWRARRWNTREATKLD